MKIFPTATTSSRQPPPEPTSSRRVAFTLVELMTVLVLTGIVALSVGYSVRPSLAAARQASALQKLTAVDRTIREECVRSGNLQELWIVGLSRLELRNPRTGESRPLESQLPIRRILTPAAESTGEVVGLRYLPDGSSPTYTLELGTPAVASRFVVFLGGSGQVLEFDDEAAVQELLSVLRITN